MLVVVTNNVSKKVRGFLASVVLEVSPGVYSSAKINRAVRDRILNILTDWVDGSRNDSAIVIWQNSLEPGGQVVKIIGLQSIDFCPIDGTLLSRKDLSDDKLCSLKSKIDVVPF